jgi:uncharacterized DUF497 family protein
LGQAFSWPPTEVNGTELLAERATVLLPGRARCCSSGTKISQRTLLERGIDFIDAALVWDDPNRQERIDSRRDYGECRYQTIGRVAFGILFVVYTARTYEDGKLVHRIISVRPANGKGIKLYEAKAFSRNVGT